MQRGRFFFPQMYDTAFDNFAGLRSETTQASDVGSILYSAGSIVSIHTVRCRLEEESDTLKVSHAVRHSRRLAIRAAKLGPKPTFYLDLSW